MKKKLLSLILMVDMLIPTMVNAKTTPYYTLKGTIYNFTYCLFNLLGYQTNVK